LRAIYLKKLSTGHDEHETHTRQLADLKKKIDEHEKIKKSKEEELSKLKIDRGRNNAEKNEEINKMKRELETVKTDEAAALDKMMKESEEKLEADKKMHQERESKLKDAMDNARKELDEKIKENKDKEDILKRQKYNAENRLDCAIREYDKEMENLTAEVNKEMGIYNEVKSELDGMEEKVRKMKHAKEVNKKMEDEWNIKLQQFEIEENRKKDSAHFIRNMWAAYKEKKKKKKKRGGMGGMR